MVLAALGKPQPEPIDADLLKVSELHLEAGPSWPPARVAGSVLDYFDASAVECE